MSTEYTSNNLGRDARLYYNSGTVASPTWVEIKEARDLTINLACDKVAVEDRSTIYKLFESGGLDFSISGSLTYRNGNANCAVLRDMMFARSAHQFAITTGPIATAGTQGLKAGMKCFSNNLGLALNDGQKVDFELAPCYYESPAAPGTQILPAWFTAS